MAKAKVKPAPEKAPQPESMNYKPNRVLELAPSSKEGLGESQYRNPTGLLGFLAKLLGGSTQQAALIRSANNLFDSCDGAANNKKYFVERIVSAIYFSPSAFA